MPYRIRTASGLQRRGKTIVLLVGVALLLASTLPGAAELKSAREPAAAAASGKAEPKGLGRTGAAKQAPAAAPRSPVGAGAAASQAKVRKLMAAILSARSLPEVQRLRQQARLSSTETVRVDTLLKQPRYKLHLQRLAGGAAQSGAKLPARGRSVPAERGGLARQSKPPSGVPTIDTSGENKRKARIKGSRIAPGPGNAALSDRNLDKDVSAESLHGQVYANMRVRPISVDANPIRTGQPFTVTFAVANDGQAYQAEQVYFVLLRQVKEDEISRYAPFVNTQPDVWDCNEILELASGVVRDVAPGEERQVSHTVRTPYDYYVSRKWKYIEVLLGDDFSRLTERLVHHHYTTVQLETGEDFPGLSIGIVAAPEAPVPAGQSFSIRYRLRNFGTLRTRDTTGYRKVLKPHAGDIRRCSDYASFYTNEGFTQVGTGSIAVPALDPGQSVEREYGYISSGCNPTVLFEVGIPDEVDMRGGGSDKACVDIYHSYADSCRDARIVGNTLHAQCQTEGRLLDDRMPWVSTSLESCDTCRGDISNDDGVLRCSR